LNSTESAVEPTGFRPWLPAANPVFLPRFEFAWVIAWHILLPAFTVVCVAFIAVLEGLGLVTGRPVYGRIATASPGVFPTRPGVRRTARARSCWPMPRW
jgi:hypothetical protein